MTDSNAPIDQNETQQDVAPLKADSHDADHIFFVDSLRALADAQAGIQPRGEFAALSDRLTRQLAGAAASRPVRVPIGPAACGVPVRPIRRRPIGPIADLLRRGCFCRWSRSCFRLNYV